MLLAALITGAITGAGALLAGALAQATGGGSTIPPDIAPLVSAGGGVTLAGCVVYIARLLATGRLVARDPAVEAEALRVIAERNALLAADSHQRENSYLELLTDRHNDRPAERRRRD